MSRKLIHARLVAQNRSSRPRRRRIDRQHGNFQCLLTHSVTTKRLNERGLAWGEPPDAAQEVCQNFRNSCCLFVFGRTHARRSGDADSNSIKSVAWHSFLQLGNQPTRFSLVVGSCGLDCGTKRVNMRIGVCLSRSCLV